MMANLIFLKCLRLELQIGLSPSPRSVCSLTKKPSSKYNSSTTQRNTAKSHTKITPNHPFCTKFHRICTSPKNTILIHPFHPTLHTMDSSFSSDLSHQTESESEYSESSQSESVDQIPPKPPCTKRSNVSERLTGQSRLGLSGQDVWNQMIPIINRAVEDADRTAEWEEATERRDENNEFSDSAWNGDKIVVDGEEEVVWEGQQAARDETLLRKR